MLKVRAGIRLYSYTYITHGGRERERERGIEREGEGEFRCTLLETNVESFEPPFQGTAVFPRLLFLVAW